MIVVEGMDALVRKAIAVGVCRVFFFKNGVSINVLQFADNTLLIVTTYGL